MEIFGGDLDDDLFGETRARCKPLLGSYNAKVCEPRWFDRQETCDPDEQMAFCKYRADLAYREQNYTRALEFYQQSRGLLLQSNNTTVLRDVDEAISRCHLALGHPNNAIEAANRVWEASINFEQKTSVLNLFVYIHYHLSQFEEAVDYLVMLLSLHPANPDLWLKLAECYGYLAVNSGCSSGAESNAEECSSGLCRPRPHSEEPQRSQSMEDAVAGLRAAKEVHALLRLKDIELEPSRVICTCLLKAKLTLYRVSHVLASFSLERNLALQKKIMLWIDQLLIPKVDVETCNKWVKSLSVNQRGEMDEDGLSEEKTVPDVQVLEPGKEMVRSEFERKWFSQNFVGG